jgi:hypothetical protein
MKLKIKKSHLAIIPLAIIFAIGLILFIGTYAKKDAFSQFTLWGAKETTIESQNKDSDNDGLKDWEENLYKTDSLNPDTDNDGYLDGEEINSGHNPLVKGPNDKQVFYPLPVGDKYNITNKIFANFSSVMDSYLEQKNQYAQDHPEITSSEEYLQQTTTNTLTEMLKRAILYNEENWANQVSTILAQLPEIFDIKVADSDIVVSENNAVDAITDYFNKISFHMNSVNFLLKESNLVLLKDSFVKNDFTEIDVLIMINDDEIAKLVDTSVPSSWKEIHKSFLETIIITRNIYVSLRGFESDPIKAMAAINEFEGIETSWDYLNQRIKSLIQSQNLNLSI